jgi:hypothetical protein
MNAVEIEEAVSNLAARPFDPVEFPFSFLEAFEITVTVHSIDSLSACHHGPNYGDSAPNFQ